MGIPPLFSSLASTPSTFGPLRLEEEKNLFQRLQAARGELRLGFLDSQTLSLVYCDANWPAKAVLIQAFRPPSLLFNSQAGLSNLVHRTFRSSGTSLGVDLRSVSRFSKVGLDVYKSLSKKTFFSAVKLRLGEKFDPNKIRLFSLVPQSKLWPDSSLAQMIEWIGEDISVVYCTEQNLSELVELEFQADPNLFAVITGTGFHFINSFDSGVRLPSKFASNYCLMETGGTKGKSRDVPRKEFYRLLCEYGSVSLDQIISEYGMSELACQAYDVVPSEKANVALEDRFFRFPFWAPLSVLVDDARSRRSGKGALIVDDLSRIDLHYPIITEDFVNLFYSESQGTCFQLLGRIPKAPLKGCSTLVEPFVSELNCDVVAATIPDTIAIPSIDTHRHFAWDKATAWMNSLLSDQDFFDALSLEFESDTFARKALSDLRASFPLTKQSAKILHHHSIIEKIRKYDRWFIVAPNNHSLASLSLIYLSLVCKTPIKIRLPRKNFQALSRSIALANFQEDLIESVPSNWTAKSYLRENHIKSLFFLFGTHETVNKIKETLGANELVIGFGTRIGATVTPISKINQDSIDAMVQDNINLRQRGCRSARLNIILDAEIHKQRQLISQLKDRAIGHFHQKLSAAERAALGIECARYRRLSATVNSNLDQGIVSAGIQLNESVVKPLALVKEMISSYEGVFPIVFLTETQFDKVFFSDNQSTTDFNLFSAHSSLLEASSHLKKLTISSKIEVCQLGSMGIQTLDRFLLQIGQVISSSL